jgi:hypothetical protein
LYQGVLGGDEGEGFLLTCAEVFARGEREIQVIGPLLEDEASFVHEGFWEN